MTGFAEIFGYLTGVVSLVVLMINASHTLLPSVKIKQLDEILDDTEKTLRTVVEDGYITDQKLIRVMYNSLTCLQGRSRYLRARTMCATSLWKEWHEFFQGLSRTIGGYIEEAKDLRAGVITTSEEERRRLERERVAEVAWGTLPPQSGNTADHRAPGQSTQYCFSRPIGPVSTDYVYLSGCAPTGLMDRSNQPECTTPSEHPIEVDITDQATENFAQDYDTY